MQSAGFNGSSVTSLVLSGFRVVSGHRWPLFALLLSCWLFALLSDALLLFIICSRRSLHRPMFAFVAALLLNSAVGSVIVYPKLLSDLLTRGGLPQVSRSGCLSQAFMSFALGGAAFLLLTAMAFDRYVSICRPLRYAALLTPAAVTLLLLLSWLLPICMVGGAVLIASRLPLCRSQVDRVFCDVHSFSRLSCGSGRSGAALLRELYNLLCIIVDVLLPSAFILFTYARILFVTARRSRGFSGKALRTCLPHLIVFLNYALSVTFDLLHRRHLSSSDPTASVVSSLLMAVGPTVLNPVVYGLKVAEIREHLFRLLGFREPAASIS